MRTRLHVLISPGFAVGLALLLFNDFVLKRQAPGLVSGKLSDFAGLWVFAMFSATLVPRHVRLIYVATAIAFVWWKSPAVQPAIDAWNAAPMFEVSRVVDYTDLLALAVLPASYAYFTRIAGSRGVGHVLLRRTSVVIAMLVSLFAFGATSAVDNTVHYVRETEGIYYFDEPAGPIIERFNALGLGYEGQTLNPEFGKDFRETFWIAIPSDLCGSHFSAQVEFRTLYDTRVFLKDIRHDCERDAHEAGAYREAFERAVIEPLHESRPSADPNALLWRVFIFDRPSDNVEYRFRASRESLMRRVEDRVLSGFDEELERPPDGVAARYWIGVRYDLCRFDAAVKFLTTEPEISSVVLGAISPDCFVTEYQRPDFLAAFERNFIEPLRAP